jgi:predicted dehydrogenase
MSEDSVSGRSLRWGLLSTARINRALLGPLAESGRSELVAVASRDPERAHAYAEQNGIPKSYGSYEALLDDPEIDVVYVSLPNHLHCEWTVAAAAAGKHVLCEKPLVLGVEELDRVEAAATSHGVTVFEAFMYLHHPQTLRVQSMVRSGELGELQALRSHFGFFLSDDSGNVRLDPDKGGGCLWDVGVYPVSFSLAMAGAGAPVEVTAVRLDGATGIDVAFEGQMRFSNDVVAQISSGFRRPLEWGATIVGSERIVHLDEPWKPGFEGTVGSVRVRSHEGEEEPLTFGEPDPYRCEVAAMEACVLDGADPVVSLVTSREILVTTLALHRSAATGVPVSPELGQQ